MICECKQNGQCGKVFELCKAHQATDILIQAIRSAIIGLSNGKGSVPMILSVLRSALFRAGEEQ